MDIHYRLHMLWDECGWSKYGFAKQSSLSESTIANIFKRNTDPTVSTLEAVCGGFGITLSQFFAEHEMVELSPELKELFNIWVPLLPEQKAAVLQLVKAMNQK